MCTQLLSVDCQPSYEKLYAKSNDNDCLNNLASISLEKKISKNLDLDIFVQFYSEHHKNRKIV